MTPSVPLEHSKEIPPEPSKRIRLERKVTIGDVLTILSIVGSVIAALYSVEKDRAVQRKEQADVVRGAAAETLGKLDRWEEMSVSIFSDIDPAFVDTKEMLRHPPGTQPDVTSARHQLWREILKQEVTVENKILDDHLEAGYTKLYTYVPDARQDFEHLMTKLNNDQFHLYAAILVRTQYLITKHGGEKDFDADGFYDELNTSAVGLKNDYWQCLDGTLSPVRKALLGFTHMSDKELMDHPPLKIPIDEIRECKFPWDEQTVIMATQP